MTTKICSTCGHEITATAKFCSDCGAALGIQKSKYASAANSGKEGLIQTGIVVGVVVLITAGYFIFSESQPVPQPVVQSPAGHEEVGPMGAGLPNLPEDFDGLVAAGDQYMNQNNFPIAAECYKRALAIDASSPDIRSDFASCLYGMGLVERALEEFRTIQKNSPLHGVTLFNLGVVFLGQNKSDSAKIYFAKYLELEPNGQASEQARTYIKELGI